MTHTELSARIVASALRDPSAVLLEAARPGVEDAPLEAKREAMTALLQSNPVQFLDRWGSLLDDLALQEFAALSDGHDVAVYLKRIRYAAPLPTFLLVAHAWLQRAAASERPCPPQSPLWFPVSKPGRILRRHLLYDRGDAHARAGALPQYGRQVS